MAVIFLIVGYASKCPRFGKKAIATPGKAGYAPDYGAAVKGCPIEISRR
jgi:hypothetical protein